MRNFFLVSTHLLTEQMKGASLVPKLALNVMSCEVLRLMVLTKSSIMPLHYHVPRKVGLDFFLTEYLTIR